TWHAVRAAVGPAGPAPSSPLSPTPVSPPEPAGAGGSVLAGAGNGRSLRPGCGDPGSCPQHCPQPGEGKAQGSPTVDPQAAPRTVRPGATASHREISRTPPDLRRGPPEAVDIHVVTLL